MITSVQKYMGFDCPAKFEIFATSLDELIDIIVSMADISYKIEKRHIRVPYDANNEAADSTLSYVLVIYGDGRGRSLEDIRIQAQVGSIKIDSDEEYEFPARVISEEYRPSVSVVAHSVAEACKLRYAGPDVIIVGNTLVYRVERKADVLNLMKHESEWAETDADKMGIRTIQKIDGRYVLSVSGTALEEMKFFKETYGYRTKKIMYELAAPVMIEDGVTYAQKPDSVKDGVVCRVDGRGLVYYCESYDAAVKAAGPWKSVKSFEEYIHEEGLTDTITHLDPDIEKSENGRYIITMRDGIDLYHIGKTLYEYMLGRIYDELPLICDEKEEKKPSEVSKEDRIRALGDEIAALSRL